jgi:hypothetical protein
MKSKNKQNKFFITLALSIFLMTSIFIMGVQKSSAGWDWATNDGSCISAQSDRAANARFSFHIYKDTGPFYAWAAASASGSYSKSASILYDSRGDPLFGMEAPKGCTGYLDYFFRIHYGSDCDGAMGYNRLNYCNGISCNLYSGNSIYVANLSPGDYTIYAVGNDQSSLAFCVPSSSLTSNSPPSIPQIYLSDTSVQNPGISFQATDPEGSNITYTYSIDNETYNLPAGVVTSGYPTGYQYAHGSLSWGPHTVYVKADDGNGGVSTNSMSFILTDPGPAINSFTASTYTVKMSNLGTNYSYLSWSTSNIAANSCSVTNNLGQVWNSLATSMSGPNFGVWPSANATYTLTCLGINGVSVSKNLDIQVLDKISLIINVNAPVGKPYWGYTLSKPDGTTFINYLTASLSDQPWGAYSLTTSPINGYIASITPSASVNAQGGDNLVFNIDYVADASSFNFGLKSVATNNALVNGKLAGRSVIAVGGASAQLGSATDQLPVRTGDLINLQVYLRDVYNVDQAGTYSCSYSGPASGACGSGINIASSTSWNVPPKSGDYTITLTASNGKKATVKVRVPQLQSLTP